jgi:hypothetical protein
MSHGNYINGQQAELAIRTIETLLANPPRRRVPASQLLNCIARDAYAAVLRDDAEAIAALPTMVQFKAHPVRSQSYPGAWRLVVIAKSCGAWGSFMGAPCCETRAQGMAEMINGPAPLLTNPAEVPPASLPSKVSLAHHLGVLGAMFGRKSQTSRVSCHPSAADGKRSSYHNERSNAPSGDLNCASSPAA